MASGTGVVVGGGKNRRRDKRDEGVPLGYAFDIFSQHVN